MLVNIPLVQMNPPLCVKSTLVSPWLGSSCKLTYSPSPASFSSLAPSSVVGEMTTVFCSSVVSVLLDTIVRRGTIRENVNEEET